MLMAHISLCAARVQRACRSLSDAWLLSLLPTSATSRRCLLPHARVERGRRPPPAAGPCSPRWPLAQPATRVAASAGAPWQKLGREAGVRADMGGSQELRGPAELEGGDRSPGGGVLRGSVGVAREAVLHV